MHSRYYFFLENIKISKSFYGHFFMGQRAPETLVPYKIVHIIFSGNIYTCQKKMKMTCQRTPFCGINCTTYIATVKVRSAWNTSIPKIILSDGVRKHFWKSSSLLYYNHSCTNNLLHIGLYFSRTMNDVER